MRVNCLPGTQLLTGGFVSMVCRAPSAAGEMILVQVVSLYKTWLESGGPAM